MRQEPFLLSGRKATLFHFAGLASRKLVLNRHHVQPVALTFLTLEAAAADAELFQQATVELLELLLSAFINNDAIRS